MNRKFHRLQNQYGKTKIIVLVLIGIIGYLVYPGTSPFKADYYNLKAEGNLKDLHRACNRYWADGIAQKLVTKATGIQKEVGNCEVAVVTQDPYNFMKLEGMQITIVDGTKVNFQATGKHSQGDKTIKINASGKIES
ncbi:MAG: hypothetical protein GWN14_03370 [candidate division Zixibacteria bacterium]|nr:hypothetical protein [candidate division Zixibacteria bacterium]